jgi:hypothetical protein
MGFASAVLIVYGVGRIWNGLDGRGIMAQVNNLMSTVLIVLGVVMFAASL